jgi:hypothetical protein
MKVMTLLLICIVILSACNRSSDSPALAPTNTQAAPKKLLGVKVGGKVGYIDRAGKLVINPQYDSFSEFSEGLAVFCVGQCDQEHWQGYRYVKGSLDTEPLEQTFKYGYIDETGKIVINPMFESAYAFKEGLAGVCAGNGCYYSRPSDKPKEEAKWGFIDRTGAFVITSQFKNVSPFHEGLAAVSVGDKWGYIDKTGKFVINPQFDSALQFENGIAEVGLKVPRKPDSIMDDYQYGYIDRTGKYIWQPSN